MIFFWHSDDFNHNSFERNTTHDWIQFIKFYCPEDVRIWLEMNSPAIHFLDYSWELKYVDGRREGEEEGGRRRKGEARGREE
jgi:hypothetical protein